MGFPRHTPHQRFIDPDDRVFFELGRQTSVRRVGLGDDHDAGGLLVQAVHQPRPLLPADRGDRAAFGSEVMEQRVDERAAPVAGRGMNDQPRRLIEHQEVGVFMEDLKGNGLRVQFQRFRTRNLQHDRVAGLDFVARFDDPAIDADAAVFDQPLKGGPGQSWFTVGEKKIKALGSFSRRDDKLSCGKRGRGSHDLGKVRPN